MESYKNPNGNKPIAQSQAFDVIKDILSSQFSTIMQHYIFNNKVMRGLVPDEDVNDYLNDLLGQGNPSVGIYMSLYLPSILATLKVRTDYYAKLIEITKFEKKDVAISALFIMLNFSIEHLRREAKVNAAISKESKFKILASLDEVEQVSLIIKKLEILLPPQHDKINKIIYSEKKSNRNNFSSESNSLPIIKCDWQYYRDKISKILSAYMKIREVFEPKTAENNTDTININLKISANEDGSYINDLMADFEDILLPIYEELSARESRNAEGNYSNISESLLANISTFYKVTPLLDKITAILTKLTNMTNKINDFINSYLKTVNKLRAIVNCCV